MFFTPEEILMDNLIKCTKDELPIKGKEDTFYFTTDTKELWHGNGEDDLLEPVISEHAHAHRVGHTFVIPGPVGATPKGGFMPPLMISIGYDNEQGIVKGMGKLHSGEAVVTLLKNGEPIEGYTGLHIDEELAAHVTACPLEEEDIIQLRVDAASPTAAHLSFAVFVETLA